MKGPWNYSETGEGDLKSKNFKRKVWGLTGISRGVGGFKQKNLPLKGPRYGYFLEQHNNKKLRPLTFDTIPLQGNTFIELLLYLTLIRRFIQ